MLLILFIIFMAFGSVFQPTKQEREMKLAIKNDIESREAMKTIMGENYLGYSYKYTKRYCRNYNVPFSEMAPLLGIYDCCKPPPDGIPKSDIPPNNSGDSQSPKQANSQDSAEVKAESKRETVIYLYNVYSLINYVNEQICLQNELLLKTNEDDILETDKTADYVIVYIPTRHRVHQGKFEVVHIIYEYQDFCVPQDKQNDDIINIRQLE